MFNTDTVIVQTLAGSLLEKAVVQPLLDLFPGLIRGLLLVLVGLSVAQLCRVLVAKSLFVVTKTKQKNDRGLSQLTAKTVAVLVFWIVFLVFLSSATYSIGLNAATQILQKILNYVPNLVFSLTIVIIATLVAKIVSGFFAVWIERSGLGYAATAKSIFEFIFIFLAVIMALDHLGINTNLLIVPAAIVISVLGVALAVSFGLGTKEIANNIVTAYYLKELYQPGDKIKVGKFEGEINQITNLVTILKTKDGQVSVANRQFFDAPVTKK